MILVATIPGRMQLIRIFSFYRRSVRSHEIQCVLSPTIFSILDVARTKLYTWRQSDELCSCGGLSHTDCCFGAIVLRIGLMGVNGCNASCSHNTTTRCLIFPHEMDSQLGAIHHALVVYICAKQIGLWRNPARVNNGSSIGIIWLTYRNLCDLKCRLSCCKQ